MPIQFCYLHAALASYPYHQYLECSLKLVDVQTERAKAGLDDSHCVTDQICMVLGKAERKVICTIPQFYISVRR